MRSFYLTYTSLSLSLFRAAALLILNTTYNHIYVQIGASQVISKHGSL